MLMNQPITPQLKNTLPDIFFHKDGEEQYKERILLFIKNKLEEKDEEFFQWYSFCVRRNSIDYLDIKEIDSPFFHKYKFEILSFFNPHYIKQLKKEIKEYTEEEKSYFNLAHVFNNSKLRDNEKKYIYVAITTKEEQTKFGRYKPSLKTYDLMKSVNIEQNYIDLRKNILVKMIFEHFPTMNSLKEIKNHLQKKYDFTLDLDNILEINQTYNHATGEFLLIQNNQELKINLKELETEKEGMFLNFNYMNRSLENRMHSLERLYNS